MKVMRGGRRVTVEVTADGGGLGHARGRRRVRAPGSGSFTAQLRELPLRSSTTAALRAYLARHDRPPSPPEERALFVSTPGTRVALDGVEQTFSLLRDRAGVPSRGGRRPTVHGLRHTFAIRTMLDAYQDGEDAGARLEILSTYLGHRRPGADERRG